MGTDLIILGLRLVFVLLLYVFLLQIVLVVVRDLRKSAAQDDNTQPDRASLVVMNDGSATIIPGQRFELEPITSIGRSPSNTINISDGFISAEHALLAYRDSQWWLEDLGSTNGTSLNHRVVKGPTPVGFGDVIEIGKIKMKMVKRRKNA